MTEIVLACSLTCSIRTVKGTMCDKKAVDAINLRSYCKLHHPDAVKRRTESSQGNRNKSSGQALFNTRTAEIRISIHDKRIGKYSGLAGRLNKGRK